MPVIAATLVVTLSLPAFGALTRDDRVRLTSRSIRLGDVMRVESVTLRKRIIATIPVGRNQVTLTRSAIANLSRRAIPGLVIAGTRQGNVTFLLREPRARVPGLCSSLTQPVSVGGVIESKMVMRVPCRHDVAAAVFFDPHISMPRAQVALAAGTYLGSLSVRTEVGLQSQEEMHLRSTVGSVQIVRTVTTMQGSRGRRVFVRDGDGQIFSVRRAELAK